jgi:hypothetical protein
MPEILMQTNLQAINEEEQAWIIVIMMISFLFKSHQERRLLQNVSAVH